MAGITIAAPTISVSNFLLLFHQNSAPIVIRPKKPPREYVLKTAITPETQDGAKYTRHGQFQLDGQGQIVNGQGEAVLTAQGGPIVVPVGSGQLTISADGTVSGDNGTIGQIGLFEFEDDSALKREAYGQYAAGDQQPQAANDSKMMQGMLEQSNVQAIVEMTRMIEIHRSYQSTANLIKSDHDQAMRAIGKLTRLRQS